MVITEKRRTVMKRIISLILACMMIFGALTLSSCVPINEKDGDAQSTTTAGTTATTAPQEPVPVDSVNGKGAKQLLEKFFSDYKNSKSFDLSMSMTTTEDGVTLTDSIDMKLTEDELYMGMTMDGADMKIWYVGGVMYVDMGGEKYKTSNSDIDDMFGAGFVDEVVSTIPTEFPEAYMKKVEAAQIYSYGGIYYFSVSVSAEEAKQMEQGDEAYTETVYFNSSGAVTRIIDRSASSTMTLNLNSYGKSVTITPPADPDSFVDMTDQGGGQASAEYAVYEQICKKLSDATVYIMETKVNGVSYMDYTTDGEGKYVKVFDGNDYYSMWSVNGNGYVAVNDQTPVLTSITEEMLSAFEAAASLKDLIAEPVDESEMDAITLESVWGTKVLAFEIEYSEDECVVYVIKFNDSYNNLYIEITEYSGQSVMKTSCRFELVSDGGFIKVNAPI